MANRYLSLEATEVVNAFEECDLDEGADPIMNTGETVEASESLPEESDLSDVAVEEDIVTQQTFVPEETNDNPDR